MRLLSLCLLCPLALAVLGAEDSLRFTALSMRDGLANPAVSSIVQDRAGFLWIGTQSGLHRYDGQTFTVYQNEPFDATSLPHNLIQTMYLDPDGHTLWLGTYGGLTRFDTRFDTFESWRFRADDNDSLNNDIVIAIGHDASGRLWVGTMEGLCYLDTDTGTIRRYRSDRPDTQPLVKDTVRSVYLDSRGWLWIGSSGGGLYRLDDSGEDFISYPAADRPEAGLPSPYVMSISEDGDGRLWLGCWFYGLASFHPLESSWQNYPLADNRSYFVNASDPELVYVGSWGGGLFSLNRSTGQLDRYQRNDANPHSISHDTLYAMFIDSFGQKWLGTNGGGLNRIWQLPAGLRVYEHDPADPSSRSAGRTSAALKDSRGRLWIGTHNSGLNLQLPGGSGFQRFRHDPQDPASLPNDIVTEIVEDSAGRIWILTNAGIARYLEDGGGFATVAHDPSRPDSLPDNIVYALLEDPGTGNFWVGTYTMGLAYWDTTSDRFRSYPARQDRPDSLSNNLVSHLAYDARGRLWIATNNGLNRYEGDGRFTRYINEPENYRSLPSQIVRRLLLDSRGRLWIATNGGGLVLYVEENDTFRYWTRRDGLPSNVILSFEEDGAGNLWISTTAGLAILDGQTGLLRPYVSFSDLRYREFSSASFRDRDGYLYFGTSNALYRIDPRVNQELSASAPLRLTAIETAMDAAGNGGPSQAAWLTKELELGWRENAVAFSFAILDYREPGGNQYAYMLSGFDENWHYPGSRSYVSYTNLPGGSYLFKVRAANNDGVWLDEEISLRLRVQNPPWQRWWAYPLYAIGLILLALAIASLRGQFILRSKVAELSSLKLSLEQANGRLMEISSHDDVTGLWNRRYFDNHLQERINQALTSRQPLSFLMLDVDQFRLYNEHYGYDEGDRCLARIAELLREECASDSCLISHFGSDSMAVLLPNTKGEVARKLAERFRLAIESKKLPHAGCGPKAVVTVSVGVSSLLPAQKKDGHRLVDLAESALYRAKQDGRNRVEMQLSPGL